MAKPIISRLYLDTFNQVIESLGHTTKPEWLPPALRSAKPGSDFITLDDFFSYVENVYAFTNDPRLSFELGKALDPPTLGFYGYAVYNAENLEDALSTVKAYLKDMISNFDLNLEIYQSYLLVRVNIAVPKNLSPFYMEVMLAAIAVFLDNGKPVQAKDKVHLNLNYPCPDYAELYQAYSLFDCRFDQPSNSFEIPLALLQRQNTEHDQVLRKLSLEQLKGNQKAHDNVVEGVSQFIREHLESRITVKDTARALNLSARTLNRKLSLSGHRFNELLTEIRLNAAIDFLNTSALSLEEIAEKIGYAHTSSFIQAFKKRFKVTPKQFRLSGGGLSD